jgi:hypothetical protein
MQIMQEEKDVTVRYDGDGMSVTWASHCIADGTSTLTLLLLTPITRLED